MHSAYAFYLLVRIRELKNYIANFFVCVFPYVQKYILCYGVNFTFWCTYANIWIHPTLQKTLSVNKLNGGKPRWSWSSFSSNDLLFITFWKSKILPSKTFSIDSLFTSSLPLSLSIIYVIIKICIWILIH